MFDNNIKELLLKLDVIHVDEAGTRVKDRLHWTHTISTSLLTYYMIHQKRGTLAIDDIKIFPIYKGIAFHDHLKAYNCSHSFCNAHHLRELTGIVENENIRWARDMHLLLTNMNKYVYNLKKIIN